MNPIIKTPKPFLLIVLLAVGLMMALTGCTEDRLAGCEGDIIVENEIPDLVMRLGDEPFRRDVIYDEPVVFRHTARNSIVITTISPHWGTIVRANSRYSPVNESVSIVEVEPLGVGETIVEVIAADDCYDRRRSTSFKVTVLESEEETNN